MYLSEKITEKYRYYKKGHWHGLNGDSHRFVWFVGLKRLQNKNLSQNRGVMKTVQKITNTENQCFMQVFLL
jgi:hypothetical protein